MENYKDLPEERERPSCKVVKMPGGGARIYPRGCKVRSVANTWGDDDLFGITTFSKDNQRKEKIKTTNQAMYVWVKAGPLNDLRPAMGRGVRFVWDTGAMPTMMSQEAADKLGVNEMSYGPSTAEEVEGVGGIVQTRTFKRVRLTVTGYQHAAGGFTPLRANIHYAVANDSSSGTRVTPGNSNNTSELLGVAHILEISKTLKVKFK